MSLINTLEIVRGVRELLSDQVHWCKGSRQVGDSFCLVGAYAFIRYGTAIPDEQPDMPISTLQLHREANEAFGLTSAVVINDDPNTTHADIIKLLNIRIAKLEAHHDPRATSISITPQPYLTNSSHGVISCSLNKKSSTAPPCSC